MAALRRLAPLVVATALALATPMPAGGDTTPPPASLVAARPPHPGPPPTTGAARAWPPRPGAHTITELAAAPGELGLAYPSADLTGDDVPDVVAFMSHGDRVRMTCRSGSDGRVVGTFAAPADSRLLWGDSAWHTAVIYETAPASPGVPDGERLTVRWVERCRQRWSRTFTAAAEDRSGSGGGTLSVRGTLASAGGRAAVAVETSTVIAVRTNLAWRSVVHVVSGEDGSSLLRSAPLTFVDEFPQVVTLPDVSGDGRGDYAYAVNDAAGLALPTRGDRLDAYASDDGRRLWTVATPAAFSPDIDPLGDVDGDETSDLVLSPLLGPREPETNGAELVSGETGSVRWRHRGWDPRVIRARPLLVSVTNLTSADGWLWLEVAAVDANGTERYASRHRVGPSANATSTYLQDESLGDIDDDGVLDVVHRITVAYEDETTRQLNLVVSGRDGMTWQRDVRSLVRFGWPAGTAVLDGQGDEVWSPGSPAIRTGDGGAEVARWRGREPVTEMLVTRADGDRCPDLFVVTGDTPKPRQLLMVSGATGKVVWSLPASKPGARVLDRPLGTCAAQRPPVAARPSPRVPTSIPATGAAPAWPAVVVAATALVAARLRRRASGVTGHARVPSRG